MEWKQKLWENDDHYNWKESISWKFQVFVKWKLYRTYYEGKRNVNNCFWEHSREGEEFGGGKMADNMKKRKYIYKEGMEQKQLETAVVFGIPQSIESQERHEMINDYYI